MEEGGEGQGEDVPQPQVPRGLHRALVYPRDPRNITGSATLTDTLGLPILFELWGLKFLNHKLPTANSLFREKKKVMHSKS